MDVNIIGRVRSSKALTLGRGGGSSTRLGGLKDLHTAEGSTQCAELSPTVQILGGL